MSAEPSPPDHDPLRPPFWRRRVRWLAPAFVAVVAAAITFLSITLSGDEPTPEPQQAAFPKTKTPPSGAKDDRTGREEGPRPEVLPDSIGNADQYAHEGRFDLALTMLQRLRVKAAPPARDILQYRIALCLEGLGRWQGAATAYRALAGQARSAATVTAAELGLVRLALREGRPAEAKALLYPLNLRSGEGQFRDRPQLAEVKYLLALALLREALHGGPVDLLGAAPAGPGALDFELPRALDWAAPLVPPGKPTAEGVKVKPFGPNPEDALVTARLDEAAVAQLLERLAGMRKWGMAWSKAARERAGMRRARVAVREVPLPEVLQGLTDPFGLVWEVGEGTLRVRTAEEAPPEEAAGRRRRTARRAVRDAVLLTPNHPLSEAAFLEVGNLEAAEGRLSEAAAWYRQLLQPARTSPHSAAASYNLGLALKRQRNPHAAIEAFYRTVDQAPGGDLAPWARLWVGRLLLEQAEYEHAAIPLRRAAAAPGHPAGPPAVVHLAAAYLLAKQPRAAHEVLSRFRPLVLGAPVRPAADLLDALARVRLAGQSEGVSRDAADLLTALVTFPRDGFLGPVGILVAGHGYQALNLRAKAVDLYETTLPNLEGPLAEEMTYTLAAFRLEATPDGKDRAGAVKMLDALATLRGSRWADPAQFYLAQVALQEGRPRECLGRCQRLLRDPNGVARSAVLELMGRCFSQMGEHQLAARCFAGEAPDWRPD